MNLESFKFKYVNKVFIQEQQFYQWLVSLFRLNIELNNEFNFNTADLFVVKFIQLFSEGAIYCEDILPILRKSNNSKAHFFQCILNFINDAKTELPVQEFDYLEYRRHNICHIFQNGYETIQNDFKIKSRLKDRSLDEINANILNLIHSEVDEFELQKKLFRKYYQRIESLRDNLQEIQRKYNI